MDAVICLLRAVNVGGHNSIKMDVLRDICGALGCQSPLTLLQSGNVVFKTPKRDLSRVATQIEDEIERRLEFRPDVILRTSSELRDVIRRNPFAKRRGLNPSKLVVTFLRDDPGTKMRNAILSLKPDSEEVRMDGKELYIYFPDGAGRSKLTPLLARTLQNSGTARNWNTVTKLLQLAEELEAGAITRRSSD